MITDIEDFFSKGCGRCERFATPDCSTRRWGSGLAELRRICLSAGLVENVKWGHPCYTHRDRNVVILGALRDSFRIGFFNAALMKDPSGILERQGPNTRHPDVISFADNSKVCELEPTILCYLDEAIGYVEAGAKPPKENVAINLPRELADAMDDDPELAEAFHALSPGRQRSYEIYLNSTTSPATRRARIVKVRPKIIAGKGAMER
jgi:uncharacterized protein YdeI (YjbR/CyaY-like superfamily)